MIIDPTIGQFIRNIEKLNKGEKIFFGTRKEAEEIYKKATLNATMILRSVGISSLKKAGFAAVDLPLTEKGDMDINRSFVEKLRNQASYEETIKVKKDAFLEILNKSDTPVLNLKKIPIEFSYAIGDDKSKLRYGDEVDKKFTKEIFTNYELQFHRENNDKNKAVNPENFIRDVGKTLNGLFR